MTPETKRKAAQAMRKNGGNIVCARPAEGGAVSEPLPCPFCGCTEIKVHEGTTFRWRIVQCDDCGAQSGEVRVQTLGDGTQTQWEADAREKAIAAWNERVECFR